MAPIEDTSATAEPVTPPKNIEATHTICARLPGSQPTSTSAISTRRRAMPPRAISVPANTKKITASSGNVLIPVSMRWTIVALSTPGSSSVANTVETPTANEIGMPSATRAMNARPSRIRIMAQSTLVPVIAAASGRTISSTISLKANTMIRKPLIGIAG